MTRRIDSIIGNNGRELIRHVIKPLAQYQKCAVPAKVRCIMATKPFQERCPQCGNIFTLAELKEMAVGDGYMRHLLVRKYDGTECVVSFDEFDPHSMCVISYRTKPVASIGTPLPSA